MNPDMAINICRKAVQTVLLGAAPMLLAGLIIGLLISVFQAATQINEQTMTLSRLRGGCSRKSFLINALRKTFVTSCLRK